MKSEFYHIFIFFRKDYNETSQAGGNMCGLWQKNKW